MLLRKDYKNAATIRLHKKGKVAYDFLGSFFKPRGGLAKSYAANLAMQLLAKTIFEKRIHPDDNMEKYFEL